MEQILIVANEKSGEMLASLLAERYRDAQVQLAGSASGARRLLLERPFDLLVVNAPLTDENGVDLSAETATESETAVLLLIKTEYAEEIAAKVEEYGVFVLEKPLHKPFFFRALGLLEASRRRTKGLSTEKGKLQDKIEEIRLVDRAKCVLIQVLGLTEAQAHRHIEKQAMDLRTHKREIAEGILKTYEV